MSSAKWATHALWIAVLAACGGGGGSGNGLAAPSSSGTPAPAPVPTPAPAPAPAPTAAPGAWSTATIGGGGALLYGCDTGTASDGFTRFLYVRPGAAGNGTRANPYGSVQAAFAAVGAGEKATLCVEEGSYTENVGALDDDMSRGYRLVGGFRSGSGYSQRDTTQALSRIAAASSALPVLRLGNHGEIVVDGFELSGGLRGLQVHGYAAGRKLTVRNNLVHHNGRVIRSAADVPAGVDANSLGGVVVSGSEVLVEYNEIHANDGGRNGAGLHIGGPADSEANRLVDGQLVIGTALATVRYNRIHHNTLRYDTPHGAGITLNTNALVQHNLVWANQGLKWDSAGGDGVGGGLIAQRPLATVTVAHNWFEGNRALKGGAAIFFDEASIGTAHDNVVVGNEGDGAIAVDGRAGGDAAGDRGYLTLVHNTVALNSGAAVLVQDSTLHAFNNLFWHNTGAADLHLAGGGDLAEAVNADRNVMKGSYVGMAGVNVANASNLEGAAVFASASLRPFGELSIASVDLRPTAAAGSDTRASFAPAHEHAGALTQPPAFDAAGVTRATPVAPGAYQP
ncbi:MAG: right-handed parallel beta-helix repeat-containing protein [Pseudomonadota bacterium]